MRYRAMRTLLSISLAVILFMGSFYSGRAQLLGKWGFAATTAGIPGTYNTVTNAAFSPAIGSSNFSGEAYLGQNGWPTGALDPASYLQFSLTPLPGRVINILTVRVAVRRGATGTPAGSGPLSWALRSSVDGYAADLGGGSLTTNLSNVTVTVPAGFELLATTVEFRLYGYQTALTSGGLNRFVIDDIEVAGSNIVLASHAAAFTLQYHPDMVSVSGRLSGVAEGDTVVLERSRIHEPFTQVDAMAVKQTADELSFGFDNQLPSGTNGAVQYRLSLRRAQAIVFVSAVRSVIVGPGAATPVTTIVYFPGHLSLNSFSQGACTLKLISTSGIVAYTKQLASFSGRQDIPLPLLARGIYYAMLIHQDAQATASFFVQ